MSGTWTRSSAPSHAAGFDVTTRRVARSELTDKDLAAWTSLAARATEPNPFFEPQVLLPAADLYPDVELMLIEAPGFLIGALPVVRTSRWRKVPAPALWVWRHKDAFLGTPLLDPEATGEALGALLDAARADKSTGLLVLEWIGLGGQVERALNAELSARGMTALLYSEDERAALTRRADGNYLAEKLSKGRRRELKRLRRQLAEHLEGEIVTTDRAGNPDAIEGFLRAEGSGWKGRAGTSFSSSEQYADFFRTVCGRFHAERRLELLVMSAGGVDFAWKVNFRSGDTTFCFKIAYDEAFARFSPGVQLELDNVEHFHAGESARSDSCAAPDNTMINRLWPDRRSYATVLVPTGGLRGFSAKQKARTTIALRRRVRRNDEQAARVR
jgi:CelD/BcsL family acetyltransferase involved in cellulose biosynthesis